MMRNVANYMILMEILFGLGSDTETVGGYPSLVFQEFPDISGKLSGRGIPNFFILDSRVLGFILNS